MKGRTVAIFVLVLIVLAFMSGFAQNKYVPRDNEELYGTWINKQDPGNFWHPQRVVVTADGYSRYSKLSDSVPVSSWKLRIDGKWMDENGNTWYRVYSLGVGEVEGVKYYELYKFSKSTTVMEIASVWFKGEREYDPSWYPTEIDANRDSYRIYYRAGN
jgi:hypothetical protein